MQYTIFMKDLPDSTLKYILISLIPYSEPNLKLAFKPNLFFNDLEKISRRKRQTVRNTYYQALKKGFVELDDQQIPRLTEIGRAKLARYQPKKLKNAQLMVVFDIPEAERAKRQRLRAVLREFHFEQVQKSVWVTDYDCKHYLATEIAQNKLKDHVIIYEALELR